MYGHLYMKVYVLAYYVYVYMYTEDRHTVF